MKENCENCHHFDGKKHENDSRTNHCGICLKFCQITFKSEICKDYFNVKNLPTDEIFKTGTYVPKPTLTELKLF